MNSVQSVRYKNEVMLVITEDGQKDDGSPIYSGLVRTYPSINSAKRLNRSDVDVTCTTEQQFNAYRRDFAMRYGIRKFDAVTVRDPIMADELRWGRSRYVDRQTLMRKPKSFSRPAAREWTGTAATH